MLVESNDFSDTQLDSGFLSLKVFYAPIRATKMMKRLCFWQWRGSGAVKCFGKSAKAPFGRSAKRPVREAQQLRQKIEKIPPLLLL